MNKIIEEKKQNSVRRIRLFRDSLSGIQELGAMKNLTVFVAGSYARNEASIYSDIDLFFVLDGSLKDLANPNINSMRALARIIDESDKLKFPTFSNDGEFLKILEVPEMAKELGGRNDDHLNYFTARMLMLLESTPVFNERIYDHVRKEIVASYFRDYTHHPRDFKPIFLINDIIRFWKTLCLNYEHKRNQPETDLDRKIKQKIKNFKLKFSRMLTCFASITAVTNLETNVGPDDIISLGHLSPFERLRHVADQRPSIKPDFESLQREYEWFLQATNVHENELLKSFHNKAFREESFKRSEVFGDSMFRIVHTVAQETGYLRYLVI